MMIDQSDTWAEEMERESRVHVLEIIVQKLTRIFGVEISDLSTFPAPPVPTVLEEPGLDVEKLRALREEASLSREELDELAELEPGSIARAESVEPTSEEIHASVDTIWKLAMAPLKQTPPRERTPLSLPGRFPRTARTGHHLTPPGVSASPRG